ncbi:MAG: hypothetical protein IJR11_06555, partial [Synergistaceae bacterium]|nr:hypothetical protein [Synergistaceae bacterium]
AQRHNDGRFDVHRAVRFLYDVHKFKQSYSVNLRIQMVEIRPLCNHCWSGFIHGRTCEDSYSGIQGTKSGRAAINDTQPRN